MTPAPWEVDGTCVWSPRAKDDPEMLGHFVVCDCQPSWAVIQNHHDAMKNARAIAALPELLAAAKAHVRAVTTSGGDGDKLAALRDVIAKMEGPC